MLIVVFFTIAKCGNNSNIHQQMNKQIKCNVYPYNRILFGHEDGWITDMYSNMDAFENYAKWRKPDTKEHIVWFWSYEMNGISKSWVFCPWIDKPIDRKQTSGCQGLGDRRTRKWLLNWVWIFLRVMQMNGIRQW